MKTNLKWFMAAILAGGLVSGITAQENAKPDITGTVKANKLNVRVKPGQNFTSIGSLNRGESVTIIKSQGNWYEIKAPQNAAVWVGADAIADGKITKSTELRGGPGVEHQSYQQAAPGQEVKVLDASRKLWVKIAPLPNLTAWVSKSYIDVPVADFGKIPGNPAAPANANPNANAGTNPGTTAKPKDKPPVDALPYVAGTAKAVTVSGVLQPVGAGAVVTHALCKSFTDLNALSYLISQKVDLKKHEGREVVLKGTQRNVRGWSVPVIEVESVTSK
jgi:SH3-like domain-containing protein